MSPISDHVVLHTGHSLMIILNASVLSAVVSFIMSRFYSEIGKNFTSEIFNAFSNIIVIQIITF